MPPLKVYPVLNRARSQRCSRPDRCTLLRPPWRSLQSNVLWENLQHPRPIPCPFGVTVGYSVVRKPFCDNSVSNSRALTNSADSYAQSLRYSSHLNWQRLAALQMRRQQIQALPKIQKINGHAFRSPPMKSVWLGVSKNLCTVSLHTGSNDTISCQPRNNFVTEPPQ